MEKLKARFWYFLQVFPLQSYFFQSKSGIKGDTVSIWAILNFNTELYHLATLRDNLIRYCMWHNVRLKRRSRQNDSHRITVVTQRNSWKSNIFDADGIRKKKKIKRASILVLTLVTLHYIYRTSILSFGGCLQEPKSILRYALDKCLNGWINEDRENLSP